jgi:DNA-directed RNA polymerase subunit N (RpoN/RPB10)
MSGSAQSKEWKRFRAHPASEGTERESSRESLWWAQTTCRRMPQTHEELMALVRDAFDAGTRWVTWQEYDQ